MTRVHPEDKAEHQRLIKPEKRPVLSKYDAGAKCCPSCYYMVYNAIRVCHGCGHEFYPSKAKPK